MPKIRGNRAQSAESVIAIRTRGGEAAAHVHRGQAAFNEALWPLPPLPPSPKYVGGRGKRVVEGREAARGPD